MNNIIELNDVHKTYGKGENSVHVLSGVSLTVEKGEFITILGQSGSGKTTLMNIIGLIDTIDQGKYILDGDDISLLSDNTYAKIRNEKIGFVFQKFNLISKYNAMYNVALPLLLQGRSYKTAKKRAMDALDMVGLSDRWHHRPNELSGGQQQRVAIARALIGGCPIILADEPTGNLDVKTGAEILEMLMELNENGKTIVLITHNTEIANMSGRVIHVEDGKIENQPTVC